MNTQRSLLRLVDVRPNEVSALAWSFFYFFLLLCSYYIIRPIRTEMIIISGIDQVHWLALGVFLSMLLIVPVFGWMTRNLSRKVFLNSVYLFFSFNLILFYLVFRAGEVTPLIARSFYIWVGVFNLFVVSVFWSFMSDIFVREQSRRLFAAIAAGGTSGAIVGPIITALLVERLGVSNLFLIAASLLVLTLYCIHKLRVWRLQNPILQIDVGQQQKPQPKLKGGVLDGIKLVTGSKYLLGICTLMLGYSLCATLLSLMVAEQIETLFPDSVTRTRLFSVIDTVVNVIALIFQLFLTSRLLQWLRMSRTLAILPGVFLLGFVLLVFAPVFFLFGGLEVLRRSFEYGVNKPAREMLYVPLKREEKYKAKNFIDTTVHRGGDLLSTWVMAGFKFLGLSSQMISLVAAIIAAGWVTMAIRVGLDYRQRVDIHTL